MTDNLPLLDVDGGRCVASADYHIKVNNSRHIVEVEKRTSSCFLFLIRIMSASEMRANPDHGLLQIWPNEEPIKASRRRL